MVGEKDKRVGRRDATNLSKPSTLPSTQNWEGGREEGRMGGREGDRREGTELTELSTLCTNNCNK